MTQEEYMLRKRKHNGKRKYKSSKKEIHKPEKKKVSRIDNRKKAKAKRRIGITEGGATPGDQRK